MAAFFRKVRISPQDRDADLIGAIRRHAEHLGRAGRDVERVAADAVVAHLACQLAEGTDVIPALTHYGEELGALYATMGRRWPQADRDAVAAMTDATLAEAAELATTSEETALVAIRRGWLALARGEMQKAVDVTNVLLPREDEGTHPGRIMSFDVNIQEIRQAAYSGNRERGLQAFRGSNRARHQQRLGFERDVS